MKIISPKQLMKEMNDIEEAFKSHEELEEFLIGLLKKKYRYELLKIKTVKQAQKLGNRIVNENTIYDFFDGTISRGILLKHNVRITCSMRFMGDVVAKLLNQILSFEKFNYMSFYMVFPEDSIIDYQEKGILKKLGLIGLYKLSVK